MKRRPCAAFTADFPDDGVMNDEGTDFIDAGGRNVAEAIAQILRDLGCEVEGPDPTDHGWDLSAKGKGRECWCEITSLYPTFFLLVEDRRAPGAPVGRGLSEALDAAMRRDGRFHDLLWYTREHGPIEEPDGHGTQSPMADDPRGVDDDLAERDRGWFWRFIVAGLLVFAMLGALARAAHHGWLPEPLNSRVLELDKSAARRAP